MRGRRAPGAWGPCAPGAWASLGAAGAARHPRGPRPLGSPPGPPRPGGRRAGRVRAGAGEDEAAYDPLAFGKAGSHKDVWEGYAQGARDDFLASLDDPDSDPVRILLYLAQEHDAVSSRAVVNLPVDSYSRRLDKLVSGCVRALEGAGLQDSEDKQAILDCCTRHLFETERYKVAASEGEQTSPYRTYSAWLLAGGKAGVGSGLGLRGEGTTSSGLLQRTDAADPGAAAVHHVLAQRCGTQVTLAALLLSLLQRLEKALGRDLDFAVLAPNDYTKLPSACVRAEASFLGVESRDLVVKVLRSLKRGYWPWAWLPDGRSDSGFLVAAEAATSSSRLNKTFADGTVMQPTGRPFGDMTLADLSCAALAAVAGGYEARDYAVVLAHQRRYGEAYEALQRAIDEEATVSGEGALLGAASTGSQARAPQELGQMEHELCQRLATHLEFQIAEKAFEMS